MTELVGLEVSEALAALGRMGITDVAVRELKNDKQGRADTMLVVRARVRGASAELVASPFIMKVTD